MEPENNDLQKLNPQITDLEIGVCNLRSIKIYPLSLGDEIEISDLIAQAFNAAMKLNIQADNEEVMMQFIAAIVDIIKKNLGRILTLITTDDAIVSKFWEKIGMAKQSRGEKLLRDMTNMQAVQAADIIYKVNFESPAKNVKSLFEKVKGSLLSQRPLQQSVKDIISPLKKSSEGPSRTEE